jgi:glycosyltransferase involved in cell wall biosynthesis
VRIVLVSREYPPETAHGGIGTQTYLKAHGLARRGHAVRVVTQSIDADRRDYKDGDVDIVRIPGYEAHLPLYNEAAEWLTYSVLVATELAAQMEREPIDVIDFPEWGGEGYVHLLNRTQWNRVPAVVQIHGPLVMFANTVSWPDRSSQFYKTGTVMEGTSLQLADAVYSSSSCSADWCARHYGLNREAIPTIHTGVDTRSFSPSVQTSGAGPTIIFAGRVTGDKGVGTLVRAAVRLVAEFPDLRLQVCGRGSADFVEELRSYAAQEGAPDLVQFLGFIAREKLPSLLSAAHVFAGPSIHEPGPGLVYLEAMACGLPVIACEGAGAAEVVLDGENGLLVPPNNEDRLADALRRLLADEDYRAAMGKRARQYVVSEADSETCVSRIEAFYVRAIESRQEDTA